MHGTSIFVTVAAGLVVAACGGPAAPPAAPENAPPSSGAGASSPATPPASTGAAKAESTPPGAPAPKDSGDAKGKAAYDDPIETEHGAIITLKPLLEKNAKTSFPKRAIGDKECWQGTSLEGDAKKDFDVLIKKCGTPTGLVEYTKPVLGKLHHEHDKRDTYKIQLYKGMCYRYFAVADSGIKDLDILVTKPNGAIIADDKTSHPVAIIEFDKSWCMEDDAEYDFHVEVDGVGSGHYMFGVWVKPKG